MQFPPLTTPLTVEYLWVFCRMLKHRLEQIAPSSKELAIGDYTLFQDTDGSLKIRDPDGVVTTLITRPP